MTLLLNENALIDFSTELGFSLSAIELLNLGVIRASNLDVLQVGSCFVVPYNLSESSDGPIEDRSCP